jgi:hypothetical protein
MILKVEPERIGKLNLEKRRESGTRLQASPDSRDTTDLNQKSRVVA